ncbi:MULTISPECIES: HAD family phosphatase [unclassified Phenylobacterium]|uniref:HAD family hydrolase n=1 Tax=unclassified Phenylobacterium TaxID=2640670 RepID=UPI000AE80018|nr:MULTISPECIES: HAD family hydrolase [unclassified Phenylobacterium]
MTAVTTEGGPDFVPAAERIAVFDNDGTLWCEQPLQVQVLFTLDRASAMAMADPALAQRQPFKAFLDHDMAAIHALGKEGVFEFAFAIHAGMPVEAFQDEVRQWLASARHPKLDRPYTQVVYQPQLELLAYLRANGFKTFIVSGGGVDFMRAFAEHVYGVPPEQVIGSSVKTELRETNGRFQLTKLAQLDTFDDRAVKPANIWLHIGRRPILAFGNSDGDQAMLRYTLDGPGRRLALIVHHDDDTRESAYDRDFKLSPLTDTLDRAAEFGIHVVSVKNDWAQVFPPAR